jgi:hypothetical protein
MNLNIEKVRVDSYEVEELACKILGLDYDEIDAGESIIEEEMVEQLNIDLELFQDIIERLIPLIEVGQSPLTNEVYKGFADTENSMWLLKIKKHV